MSECSGLFFSIVFHELSHSLVARKVGTKIEGITLFMFGGVAEMGEDSPGPLAEFLMAVAGPISSIVLSAHLLQCRYIHHRAGPDCRGALVSGDDKCDPRTL